MSLRCGIRRPSGRFCVLVFLVCVLVAFDWEGLVGRDAAIGICMKTNQKKKKRQKAKRESARGAPEGGTSHASPEWTGYSSECGMMVHVQRADGDDCSTVVSLGVGV